MKTETYTGPKNAWEIIWEQVQWAIDESPPEEAKQIQAALNSIYEGSE